MRCRYCGMDSRDPHVCEWCKKPFAQGAQPQAPRPAAGMDLTQPMPTGRDLTQPMSAAMEPTQAIPQHQFRTALTGEVVPVAPAAAPGGYPQQPYPQQGYPQPQAQGYQQQYPQAPQQPYPQAVVGRPPSAMPAHLHGLPHQAIGPDLLRHTSESSVTPMSERWEKCLAISLPILLLSVWIVHLSPNMLSWVLLADLFFIPLAMGATAAIGSYDDAFMDVGAVLIVAIFFGPAIALAVYGIIAGIKQEGNGAIVALLTSHLLIRFIAILAFPVTAGAFTVMPALMMYNLIGMLAICATFAGWILSSFFRPFNE